MGIYITKHERDTGRKQLLRKKYKEGRKIEELEKRFERAVLNNDYRSAKYFDESITETYKRNGVNE